LPSFLGPEAGARDIDWEVKAKDFDSVDNKDNKKQVEESLLADFKAFAKQRP
jgi:hypothetical protein